MAQDNRSYQSSGINSSIFKESSKASKHSQNASQKFGQEKGFNDKFKPNDNKLDNESIEFQSLKPGANFSYFPIILQNEKTLLNIEQVLNENNIYPRRYFYPSVNLFNNIVDYSKCENSENISKKILCLPLYTELKLDDIDRIVNLILRAL